MTLENTSEEERNFLNGPEFYDKAKEYWSTIKPTVDGVLGGFGHISHADISGSKHFLDHLFSSDTPPKKNRALDCGAGIGRVTKHLLAKYFDRVDLIDQNKDFVEKVNEYVGHIPQIGNLYVAGLQEFEPSEQYDLIWCQWVLVHLTDSDFIDFMKKCQKSLAEGGCIVIKENVTSSGERETDTIDSSVTRPLDVLTNLLEMSGLEMVNSRYQKHFPKGLYPVIMMVWRPRPDSLP